jgi:putative DNA primase/helicase
MTGWTHEQVFQLWYGTGANGKSTLLDTVQEILGDYAQTMASDMLMERRQPRDSGGPSPDIARMRGVRLAAGVETKDGQRWNESLVKQLTGGDAIVARHLHQSPIEFKNEAKLILAVNHKPVVRGMDHGMWRRIHLVPFEARFDEKTADKSLGWQLRQEAPGIFALLVAHCVEWQRIGLDPPARVLAEVEAYRKGQDVVGAFLEECCEIDGTQTTGRGDLYNAYRMWAAQSGEYCHGKHAFNNALRERGYEEKKSGGMVWCGIKLVVKGF